MNPRLTILLAPALFLACQTAGPIAAGPDTSEGDEKSPPREIEGGEKAEGKPIDSPPVVEPGATVTKAEDVVLDGFRLGESFAEVMKRAPYDKPCDMDLVAGGARNVVLLAGKPCRNSTFPEGTTAFFLLTASKEDKDDSDAALARPIEVVGWLGGTYFGSRGNLPVKVGATAEDATAALGEVTSKMQIGTAFEAVTDDPDPKPVGDPLMARAHKGDIWSVTRSGVAVGFVVGPMPADAEDEQWRSISRLFFTYVAAD